MLMPVLLPGWKTQSLAFSALAYAIDSFSRLSVAVSMGFDGEAMFMSAKGACTVNWMLRDLAALLSAATLFLVSAWRPSSRTSTYGVSTLSRRLSMLLNGSLRQYSIERPIFGLDMRVFLFLVLRVYLVRFAFNNSSLRLLCSL